MVANVIFLFLILSAIYGIVILGLVLLLRKMGVCGERAIILSFLAFGAVTGILTAWVWPIDSSIYFNLFASFFGDQVYNLSIQYFGDPNSPQAHYTIPWILRIPQVYVITSIVVCGLVGLPLQWVYNRGLKVTKAVSRSLHRLPGLQEIPSCGCSVMEPSRKANPNEEVHRQLLEVVIAFVAYYGLTVLSRFVQPLFYLVVLTGMAFPLIWAKLTGDWAAIGFTRRNWRQALLWGTVTGVALLCLTYIVLTSIGIQPAPGTLARQLLVGIPLSILVISPFQEFLFRGWMQPRFQSALGRVTGLLACSLCFALWDALPPLEGASALAIIGTSIKLIPLSFGFALVVGYIFQRTGSILAPWLAHSLAILGLLITGRLVLV